MDQQKVDMYLTVNAKYFPAEAIGALKEKLVAAPDSKLDQLNAAALKDPDAMLWVSFTFGTLGVDRFSFGETGMGVLKLLTLGLFGILTIVDMVKIKKKTRANNLQKVMAIL